LGKFRYLLLDISETEGDDDFGNTFLSEIDVIGTRSGAPSTSPTTSAAAATQPVRIEGKHVTLDLTQAPGPKDWAESKLMPACDEWCPKIAALLASDDYTPPQRCTIEFRSNMRRGIPAATSGDRVSCNIGWFRRNR